MSDNAVQLLTEWRVRALAAEAELAEVKRVRDNLEKAYEARKRDYQTVADQLYASCICDPNPETTEGMLEDCPVHGTEEHRPLALKAAVERARGRLDALIAAGFDATTDTLRDLRAALDAPGGGQPCPRCEGSKVEPGTEQEGDWVPGAMAHLPYTGEPCTGCGGTGNAGAGQ